MTTATTYENDKLTHRTHINTLLVRMVRSKSAKNKTALRAKIVDAEAKFKTAYGYGMTYHWQAA